MSLSDNLFTHHKSLVHSTKTRETRWTRPPVPVVIPLSQLQMGLLAKPHLNSTPLNSSQLPPTTLDSPSRRPPPPRRINTDLDATLRPHPPSQFVSSPLSECAQTRSVSTSNLPLAPSLMPPEKPFLSRLSSSTNLRSKMDISPSASPTSSPTKKLKASRKSSSGLISFPKLFRQNTQQLPLPESASPAFASQQISPASELPVDDWPLPVHRGPPVRVRTKSVPSFFGGGGGKPERPIVHRLATTIGNPSIDLGT